MPTLNLEPQVTADDGIAVVELNEINNDDEFYSGLLVGYSWEPDDEASHAYIRFPNATIPQGATISAAWLEFAAVGSIPSAGQSMHTRIYAVDEDDHAAPTTFAAWSTDHGIHTTASVEWDFTSVTSGTLTSPSLVAVIQEIVNRGGWASGNDIGIHWDEDGGTPTDDTWGQLVSSFDGATSPILHIEYVSSTLEQEGFRFRNDDGSESAATWRETQDSNAEVSFGG